MRSRWSPHLPHLLLALLDVGTSKGCRLVVCRDVHGLSHGMVPWAEVLDSAGTFTGLTLLSRSLGEVLCAKEPVVPSGLHAAPAPLLVS